MYNVRLTKLESQFIHCDSANVHSLCSLSSNLQNCNPLGGFRRNLEKTSIGNWIEPHDGCPYRVYISSVSRGLNHDTYQGNQARQLICFLIICDEIYTKKIALFYTDHMEST